MLSNEHLANTKWYEPNLISFHRYTASQLWEYLQLPQWQGVLPSSISRCQSLLHHPCLTSEDRIAYLAVENGSLISFRTLLPEQLGKLRLAWLSGVWTHPQYRRKGLALRLLKLAQDDWEDKLLLTNFVPSSAAVAQKAGFQPYLSRPGLRYYLRGEMVQRLAGRIPAFGHPFLTLGDHIINQWQALQKAPDPSLAQAPNMLKHSSPLLSLDPILTSLSTQELISQNAKRWDHLLTYSWVKLRQDANPLSTNYPFTHLVNQYHRNVMSWGASPHKPEEIWMAFMVNKKASMPFYYRTSDNSYVVHWLRSWLYQHAATSFTTYQPKLMQAIQQNGGLGYARKPQHQHILASASLIPHLPDPDSLNIQDGWGDPAFV